MQLVPGEVPPDELPRPDERPPAVGAGHCLGTGPKWMDRYPQNNPAQSAKRQGKKPGLKKSRRKCFMHFQVRKCTWRRMWKWRSPGESQPVLGDTWTAGGEDRALMEAFPSGPQEDPFRFHPRASGAPG